MIIIIISTIIFIDIKKTITLCSGLGRVGVREERKVSEASGKEKQTIKLMRLLIDSQGTARGYPSFYDLV